MIRPDSTVFSTDERSKRLPVIIEPKTEQSIVFNVKSDYITIDLFCDDIMVGEFGNDVKEDVPVGEEETSEDAGKRLIRYIYSRDDGSRCRFRIYRKPDEHGDEFSKVYNVNFIKLAVDDLLFLCRNMFEGLLSINCNTKKMEDPEEKERCLLNRSKVFVELEEELTRCPIQFSLANLRLRVTSAREILPLLKIIVNCKPEQHFFGVHSEIENFDVLDLRLFRDIDFWKESNFLMTYNLVCLAQAEDLVNFGKLNTEVQSFSIADIEALTQSIGELRLWPVIIICRDEINWDPIEGQLRRDYENVLELKDREVNLYYKSKKFGRRFVRRVYPHCLAFIPWETEMRALNGAMSQTGRVVRFPEDERAGEDLSNELSARMTVESSRVVIELFNKVPDDDFLLDKYIYSDDEDEGCLFKNVLKDEESRSNDSERLYRVDFIQLAVYNFLLLVHNKRLHDLIIDCNTEGSEDEVERSLENRTNMFIELGNDIIVNGSFQRINLYAQGLRLSVTSIGDLTMLIRRFREYPRKIHLIGIHSSPESYDVLNLSLVKTRPFWMEARVFKTTNLICDTTQAVELHLFDEVDVEVDSLDPNYIDTLSQYYWFRFETIKIVIKCRQPIFFNEDPGGDEDGVEDPDDRYGLNEHGPFKQQISRALITRRVYNNCLVFIKTKKTLGIIVS